MDINAFCVGITVLLANASNLVTAAGGVFAMIALYRNRGKINRLLQLFDGMFLAQRSTELKDAVKKIEALDWSQKEDKPKVLNLIAVLCGRMKGLAVDYPELTELYIRVESIHSKKSKLNSEPEKILLTTEIHEALERIIHGHRTQAAVKGDNGQ